MSGFSSGCIACGSQITDASPSVVFCSDFCEEIGECAYMTHWAGMGSRQILEFVLDLVTRRAKV